MTDDATTRAAEALERIAAALERIADRDAKPVKVRMPLTDAQRAAVYRTVHDKMTADGSLENARADRDKKNLATTHLITTATERQPYAEAETPWPAGSRVYFARCGRYIKIGFASDVMRRLGELRTASPGEVTLIATMHGGVELEAALHHLFRKERHRGEWFHAAPAIQDFIQQAAIRVRQ